MTPARKRRMGFATMAPEQQKAIASKGGKAAHAKGTAHEFDAQEARVAGRKGGIAVSRNREHMAAIGRKGSASGKARRTAAREARASATAPLNGARIHPQSA